MKTYETYFYIQHSQFDRYGRFKVNAWSDLLQEAAAQHAAVLGVGMEHIYTENLCWILARVKFTVSGNPVPGEKVRVFTYPSGSKRLFATREFQIFDPNGNELLRGSSRWMMLDRSTGKPVSLNLISDILPDNSALPQFFDFSDKLPQMENFDRQLAIPVRHTMEDVNEHLNNAEYVAAAQDVLFADGKRYNITGADIAYHLPLRAPDILNMGIVINGKTVNFTGTNQENKHSVSGNFTLAD